MPSEIFVLNPNSSAVMTAAMDAGLDGLRQISPLPIRCERSLEAPIGIQSDADVVLAGQLVQPIVAQSDAAAFIIACFSDPGLEEARARRPDLALIGIAEAAYYAALQLGKRFGVISLSASSVARHAVHIERLGLSARLAADRPVDMTVAEAGCADTAYGEMLEAGRMLRDTDRADVVILGCAGMGVHRARLQDALGCPVVDPVQAAVAAAISSVTLGYFQRNDA